jgi:hypothetical protein
MASMREYLETEFRQHLHERAFGEPITQRISQLHDFSLHHVLSILQSFYTSRQNSKKQTSV